MSSNEQTQAELRVLALRIQEALDNRRGINLHRKEVALVYACLGASCTQPATVFRILKEQERDKS